MNIDAVLNIHYSAPEIIWNEIEQVYREMPYWTGDGQFPQWKDESVELTVSVEPSGIRFQGEMPEDIWNDWYSLLKSKLSQTLGYEIGDPEEGYRFKYWEPFIKNYADINSVDEEKIVFKDLSQFYLEEFDFVEEYLDVKEPYIALVSEHMELLIFFQNRVLFAKRKTQKDIADFLKRIKLLCDRQKGRV